MSPDGATVYAAGFHTGNKTTSIHRLLVEAGGGPPAPITNFQGASQPPIALVVKWNGAHWVDESNHTWDEAVKLSLPDKDVFKINAMANPPAAVLGASGAFAGVGTILYTMAVNPVSGKVYVANTEAFNLDRFEGPGVFAGTSVRGHLHESRITVLSGTSVDPRHLNKHINYANCCAPIPNPENAKSLASPTGMAVTADGKTLYVAALGSSKIGVFKTAELESDTFVPNTANQIAVTGGGPTGLVLDEAHHRLYALTRFDNSISVVDTVSRAQTAHLAMHNPEPQSVTLGRRFLYDAKSSSSHGDSSCSSCHVFGDLDDLAWDLGNPDGVTLNNPGPFGSVFSNDPELTNFHPLKGAMTTQSLRGMANHGPMHWRGDRTGGNDAPSAQPNSGGFDERAAFKKFAPAFADLLGRSAPISDAEITAFGDFILQLMYPPNPIRSLDNSLTPDQQAGRDHFLDPTAATPAGCVSCHVTNPAGNAEFNVPFPGFFGGDGRLTVGEVAQPMKVPHFRNLYQKVGMFGMASVATIAPSNNGFMGDQIRGFGFTNDGSHDTVFRFEKTFGFDEGPFAATGFDDSPGGDGDAVRRQVEQYLLAFDTNLAPIVGQQTTLTATNAAVAGARISLLLARASAGECELIAKTLDGGTEIGFFYTGAGKFTRDRVSQPKITDAALRAMAAGSKHEVTYTCVPPGSGRRLGIDRDDDGILDGDDHDCH